MRKHASGRYVAGGDGRAQSAAAAALCAFLSLQIGTALGQEAGSVSIELNRLEQIEGACQTYLVVGNGTEVDFESLGLDLVMFDPEGVVTRRLALELAPLPADKTSVRIFSIEGSGCNNLGRVLLNSVVSCRDASGDRPDCLALIETSSRTSADFIE